MIEGIFVEGLIYGIMVLGVFITFRILDFPDLTVDGSFLLELQ
jgi:putative ABC transport system permease protein